MLCDWETRWVLLNIPKAARPQRTQVVGSVGRSSLAYQKNKVINIAFSKKTVSSEQGRQKCSSCL